MLRERSRESSIEGNVEADGVKRLVVLRRCFKDRFEVIKEGIVELVTAGEKGARLKVV